MTNHDVAQVDHSRSITGDDVFVGCGADPPLVFPVAVVPLVNRVATGPPRWMQVIHGGNVLNDVRGLRERPAAANREFDITLPFRIHVGPVTFTREWIVSLGRLAMLCMRQPARLRERVRAAGLRFAGTRVWAQRG